MSLAILDNPVLLTMGITFFVLLVFSLWRAYSLFGEIDD